MCQSHENGMDVIIVSTSSQAQADYWQRRLDAGRGQVCPARTVIIALEEDWPGGAGNGLGTLYAWEKACRLAKAGDGTDLPGLLRKGNSVAIYHTAGKGTRLAPLPGSECNNKPAVKLPGTLQIDGETAPVTILESVIRQTSIYAASRKGRLSVFWGDQVFIPATRCDYRPSHPVDIICSLRKMPDEAAWQRDGLQNYGLIAVDAKGSAKQIEKISYAEASALIESGQLSVEGGIGTSVGSFSVSEKMLMLLLDVFSDELDAKRGKLDTDPHFWMPLTLDADTYQDVMRRKGMSPAAAREHHASMQTVARRLGPDDAEAILGAVDIGPDAYWWDYGQLSGYRRCLTRLMDDDDEAAAMRAFFGIEGPHTDSELGPSLVTDANSVIIASKIHSGRIENSVVIGAEIGNATLSDSIVVHSAVADLSAVDALLYNVVDAGSVRLTGGSVRADVFLPPASHERLLTTVSRDGKADWDTALEGNVLSYADLYRENHATTPATTEAAMKTAWKDCVAVTAGA